MAGSAPGILGRIKLTTAIAAMVVIGILVSFAATLVAVQMALTSRIEGTAEQSRQNAIRAAATVLKSEMNGAVVTWSRWRVGASFSIDAMARARSRPSSSATAMAASVA